MSIASVTVEDEIRMPEQKGRQVKADEAWVSARIPRTAEADLKALAQREQRSISGMLRLLILEALEARREREGRP